MKYGDLTREEASIFFGQIEPYVYDKHDGVDIHQLIEAIMDGKIPAVRWTGNINYSLKSLTHDIKSTPTNKS